MLVGNDVVLVLQAINLICLKITRWMCPVISPVVLFSNSNPSSTYR